MRKHKSIYYDHLRLTWCAECDELPLELEPVYMQQIIAAGEVVAPPAPDLIVFFGYVLLPRKMTKRIRKKVTKQPWRYCGRYTR